MKLEKHRAFHYPGHRVMLCAFWKRLHIREKESWDGRQTGCTDMWKGNFCAVWNKMSSMRKGVSTVEIWIPKHVKTSEKETVDGQNIQTLQHTLCWTPAPRNLNVSRRVLAISHPSIAVPIGVCGMPHIPVDTVSLADVSKPFGIEISTVETSVCMLLIIFQTAQNITFSRSMQPVCLPSHAFFSLMCNLLQNTQNISFSNENATCVPMRKTLPCHILCNLCVSRPIFSFPRNRNS